MPMRTSSPKRSLASDEALEGNGVYLPSGSAPCHQSGKGEVEKILEEGAISTVYQGIYSLRSGHLLGFEALTRGPAGSHLEKPLALFDCAKKHNLLFHLERLSRRRAIEGAREFLAKKRLFLNVDPDVMNDPDFRSGVTRSLLSEYGMTEEDVVIELTERSAIQDYDECATTLSHYRDQGYTIAIDDAGSGYSSLQAIAEFQPTYVKIDRSSVWV